MRQKRDPYVTEAQKDGWRSRAAFKLIQIDKKHHIFQKGQHIIDLGAAPGGWSQVALHKIGTASGPGCVIGIDLCEVAPLQGALFLKDDFTVLAAQEKLKQTLLKRSGSEKADVILSDMAPSMMGHQQTDHLKSMVLAEEALEFAARLLKPSGHFVCKVFQGVEEPLFRKKVKSLFHAFWVAKPDASRSTSPECYFVGKNFCPLK